MSGENTQGFATNDWLLPFPKPKDWPPQAKEEVKTLSQQIKEMVPLPPREYYESQYDYLRGVSLMTSFRQSIVRIAENPNLTREETNLGFFVEQLEPQVKNAVMEMRKKGYQTTNSGFSGNNQIIEVEGGFSFGNEVIAKLHEMGIVIVRKNGNNVLEFPMSEEDTLQTLTEKWNKVVGLIPDTGRKVKEAWRTDRADVMKASAMGRRRARLFKEVEEDSEIEFHFPRYYDIRGKLKSLVIGFTPFRWG